MDEIADLLNKGSHFDAMLDALKAIARGLPISGSSNLAAHTIAKVEGRE